jgi:hypothetical protein
VSSSIEPRDIGLWKLVETRHWAFREVRIRHFARKRPSGRRDEQGAVQRVANLPQIDELAGKKRDHRLAPIRSTTSLTQGLIEE